MAKKKARKAPAPLVYVPGWLVEQFQIEEGGEGLKADSMERFQVGMFPSKDFGQVKVEFEAASGQSNWWNTINVFDRHGELISQSEPAFDLLGGQEYHLPDGTVIQFEVVKEEDSPRRWSPQKKLSGPTMGLDTAEERQHARALAMQIHSLARDGGPIARAEARGYLRAIRDLAIDESAPELAEQMEKLLEDMK